jgi:hypothetical protein
MNKTKNKKPAVRLDGNTRKKTREGYKLNSIGKTRSPRLAEFKRN